MGKQKFIVINGSTSGVGTTTIANYTAVELAKRGYLTLLIEFKTRTGQSIYMQKGLHETHKSLCEVMSIPEKLNENTIRSAHCQKLFYLCMNFMDDSLKMQNYQPYNIASIVSEAKKYFDYIILDLPSDGREPAVATAYSSEFIHKADHQIVVVDEQATTFKYLNDFNAILQLANETKPRETTFILNSVEAAHYQDYIVEYLPSLPITKPVNLVYLPYLEGLSVVCNKGNIYETGISKKTRLFFNQIDRIVDIIEKDLKSIKADLSDDDSEEKKGFLSGLFSKKSTPTETKDKKKKPAKPKKKAKPAKPQKKAVKKAPPKEEEYDEDDEISIYENDDYDLED